MLPDRSRRAVLAGSGTALLTGVAGCLFGGGSDDGGDGGDGGGDGGSNGGAATYSVEVRNDITPEDIEAAPARVKGGEFPENESKEIETVTLTPDEPAEIRVEAARSVQGQEDPILFEKELSVPPATTETFEDAFTVEEGPTYVVSAEMASLWPGDDTGSRDYFEQHRFSQGDFNTPDGDTFYVVVEDGDESSTLDVDFWLRGSKPGSG